MSATTDTVVTVCGDCQHAHPVGKPCQTWRLERVRVTWVRWDPRLLRDRISHPLVWQLTDPDGYDRTFETKREALAFVASWSA